MNKYAFSIKLLGKDQKDCVPSSYDPIFDRWTKLGCIVTKKFAEPDKTNRCHIHGIVEIPRGFLRKKLEKSGVYNNHFEEIYDERGWINYCRKHQTNQPVLKKLF